MRLVGWPPPSSILVISLDLFFVGLCSLKVVINVNCSDIERTSPSNHESYMVAPEGTLDDMRFWFKSSSLPACTALVENKHAVSTVTCNFIKTLVSNNVYKLWYKIELIRANMDVGHILNYAENEWWRCVGMTLDWTIHTIQVHILHCTLYVVSCRVLPLKVSNREPYCNMMGN